MRNRVLEKAVAIENRLKPLAHLYLLVRKHEQASKRMNQHLTGRGYKSDEVLAYSQMLSKARKEVSEQISSIVSEHPVYVKYFTRLKGVGEVFSAIIIALAPARNFANISKLWKYAGLTPESKRVRGQRTNYNVKLKTALYTVVSNMLMQKSVYKQVYDNFKAEEKEKHPELSRLHVHMRAMRKTMKLLAAHYWLAYRKTLGLPVTKPYAHAILGHRDYIDVLVDKPEPGRWSP